MCSFGPHAKVSSVSKPAALSLQILACIYEIAHNLMAIDFEHMLMAFVLLLLKT